MSVFDRPISRRQVLKASAAVPAALFLGSGAPAALAAARASGVSRRSMSSTTVTFSNWWGSQFGHYFKTMSQLDPAVTIDQQLYPYSTTKLFTELDAGTAADFFLTDSHWNGTLLPEASRILAPFDAALKSSKIDMSKWNIPPQVDNGWDGQIWGLDVFVTQDAINFVNTEMADKDGLLAELPLWGKPNFDTWNWTKFVEWLQAGTKITSSGKVEQYGYSCSPSFIFQPMVASFGGALMNDQFGLNETKALFNTEPVIETVQAIADLYNKYKVAAPLGVEAAVTGGTYLAKKSLCTTSWSTPSVLPVQDNFPMSYWHFPYTEHKVHAVGSNSLNVNKSFSDPALIQDWIITFLSNAEVRKEFIVWSSTPAYDPLPIVNSLPAGDPKTIALINLSRIVGQSPIPSDTADVLRWPYWLGRYAPAQFADAMTSVPEAVILGKATAKQACESANSQLNAAIAQGRSAAGM